MQDRHGGLSLRVMGAERGMKASNPSLTATPHQPFKMRKGKRDGATDCELTSFPSPLLPGGVTGFNRIIHRSKPSKQPLLSSIKEAMRPLPSPVSPLTGLWRDGFLIASSIAPRHQNNPSSHLSKKPYPLSRLPSPLLPGCGRGSRGGLPIPPIDLQHGVCHIAVAKVLMHGAFACLAHRLSASMVVHHPQQAGGQCLG